MLQRFANGSLSPDEIFFHMGNRASLQSYQHAKSSELSLLVIRHGQVYLQSLRRRGSLIVGTVGLHTCAGWKTVAGFQKLSERKT